MTRIQTAALKPDPSSTALTSDPMNETTARLIAGHEEVGIICVSGRRDERKGILLNYITQYLSWLASDTNDGQDHRKVIFARESQSRQDGVYMFPQSFLVRMENKMGIVNQKLPLLLIDASPEDGTNAADICVNFTKTAVFSPEDIVNTINNMILGWKEATQDISDQMIAERDRQGSLICLLRDWSTDVPALTTVDWFSLPQHSLDVCPFFKSFVYHMFGKVCQSHHSDDILAWQRICRTVVYKSPDELVVEGMVRVYVNRMRRHLSGPEVSIESLNTMHTKILKEVMEQLRNRNFPVQFKLHKKPILNKRLNDEFQILSDKYEQWMEERKELLILQLQKQYIMALKDAVSGNGIEDHDLHKIHTTEMRKVMSEFRSQCVASDHDLSERITAAFRDLKKLNAASRRQPEAKAFDDVRVPFVQMFSDEMTKYVNSLTVMITKQAERQHELIYGRLLWKIDKSLKDQKVKTADQKKVKKEIEQQVNKLSQEIITRRNEQLREQAERMGELFMQYVKKMHHEMNTTPFMDREESDSKHEGVMNETLNQWHQDEESKQVLTERLQQKYLILWNQLQVQKVERVNGIHEYVTRIIHAYENKMKSEFASSTANRVQLDQIQNKTVQMMMKMYKNQTDVKDVGHHLPQIEEGLKEQLGQLYDNMWKDQEKQSQETHDRACASVTLLVDKLVNEYNERMSKFCNRPRRRGTTLYALNQVQEAIQKNILQKFRADGFVKKAGNSMAHMEHSLNDKMSEAFAGYKVKLENQLPRQCQAECQQLVDRCFNDYVDSMKFVFNGNRSKSLSEFTEVHNEVMSGKVEILESNHFWKKCPERHVHRDQLVSRIVSESEKEMDRLMSSDDKAEASASNSNDDDRSMIEEAVTEANAFYAFFMQFCLMNEKNNQMDYVNIYQQHVKIQADSVVLLQMMLGNGCESSLEGASDKLKDKNREDLGYFAHTYSRHYPPSLSDVLLNWSLSSFNLLAGASKERTFLDDTGIDVVEHRMKQLFDCRVERMMRQKPNTDRLDVKQQIFKQMIDIMVRKRVTEKIIQSVRRMLQLELTVIGNTTHL